MQNYQLKILAKPSMPAIDLEEVKQYLRVDGNSEDLTIINIINAVTASAEHHLKSTLQPKIWQISYTNKVQSCIDLPYGPVTSIEKIEIVNSNLVSSTIKTSSYKLIGDQLQLATAYIGKIIMISYQAGYLSLPDDIKQAMLIHITAIYESRISNIATPKSALTLYQPYRKVQL